MFRRRQQSDTDVPRPAILSREATSALRVERPDSAAVGTCTELTDIWYVAERSSPRRRKPLFEPYFIARCECGWLGTASDADDSSAFENVCAEAFGHSGNVVSDVARPLD